jgi:GNAT superfamily N-acetyltransferase
MAHVLGIDKASIQIRRLAPADFDNAVAIDAGILGRRRPAYFERRLQSALKDPDEHVQFAATQDGELAGYALARRMAGEFGRAEPALRLETIGVVPQRQGRGIGMQLLGEMERWGRKHGIREIRTSADWRHHAMLRFFDHAGFELGRNHVIGCTLHGGEIPESETEEALERSQGHTASERDYGGPAPNDYERLARDRADLRSLSSRDLPDIVRIDRRITGRDRTEYITRLVNEALGDSAIRVSLAAYRDGSVAGFVMAKVDIGDFGRLEPVAVIDTLGVDPGFAGVGIGTALLSQLFVNLKALRIERVETVVTRDDFGLLGFFYRCGFGPGARLAFLKSIA